MSAATDVAPDWINGAPEDLRRWRNARPEVVDPVLPADVVISALAPMGGCPGGLVFTPCGATGTPVVYFHGGGFIVGSPETHRLNTAWIAHIARAPVYSIRYRLAPEHRLPAQATDAVAATRRQLAAHPRLRLMGDSAGGLVALWAYGGLAPDERGRIEDAVLFYAGGGASMPAPAVTDGDERDGLGPKSLAAYQRKLDPDGIAPGNRLFDPMASGFALPQPTIVVGAGADPVLSSSRALAVLPGARLIVASGQTHGFLGTLPAEPALGHLRQALGAGR